MVRQATPILYGAIPLHSAVLLSHNGVLIKKDEDGKFPYEYSSDESVTVAFKEMIPLKK